VWLRDGVDRLFHAVSVWELPPEEDGPTAVCGRRVLVVSLLCQAPGSMEAGLSPIDGLPDGLVGAVELLVLHGWD
jgi:hypothetical protein